MVAAPGAPELSARCFFTPTVATLGAGPGFFHGSVLMAGGLCENGFNHQRFLPGTPPPTGEQGCVYKYGKATMVKLDDVAAWHGRGQLF